MDPLVTIAITSYNYGHHIADAIRSALSQTYRNVEVLVLDNASTDNSLAVIRTFSDDRLRVIERPQNIGIQRNHNDAIREARGEYIVFLSADDMLAPTLVAEMISFRRLHPQVDIVYASAIIMDPAGIFQYYFDHPSFDGADSYEGRHEFGSLLTRDSCMYLPTILFPRAIFDELGLLDEELEIVLDYEYGIRMASAGKRFAFVSTPGALIRFHGENRSGVKNFVKTGKQLREFSTLLHRYTQPKYHQQLAGWGLELNAMLDRKIAEIGDLFPQDLAQLLPELQPHIDKARASIADVPAVGDSVLDGRGCISVIVPFRGRIGPFQRALESLAKQRYTNWEAVVVCDAVFDPSSVIASSRLQERVRVVRARTAHGPAAIRNLGIGCAQGEIICYLDEDNRFAPGYLERIAAAFRDPRVMVTAGAASVTVFAHASALRSADVLAGVTSGFKVSRTSNSLPLNAVAHRRSCFARAGRFNPGLTVLEDWEFLLRLNSAFEVTPVEGSACDIGVDVHLQGHHLFGRRNSAVWNEFVARLQDIYNAYAPCDQREADSRTAYVRSLQDIVKEGVNSPGKPDEVLRFVLGLMGTRDAARVSA